MQFVRMMAFAALINGLAGCATLPIGTEGIKAFYCGTDDQPGAYVPVRWSVNDTTETLRQVRANNAVYRATC